MSWSLLNACWIRCWIKNTSVIVYPSGRYSQVTIDQAKKADYKLGLTTKNGLASSADGLYALKRVRILPTTTGEDPSHDPRIKKESGTEIGNSLEFDFVVPLLRTVE